MNPRQVAANEAFARHVQTRLAASGHYRGRIDSWAGPITLAAFNAAFDEPFADVLPQPVPAQPAGRRIAIMVGHNAVAQGARRVKDGVSEFVWNGDLAQRIARLGADVRVFNRTSGPNEFGRAYGEVAAWRADCAVELHFNAATPAAHGCETLWGRSPRSQEFAGVMQRAMLAALGNRDRGLLDRRTGNGSSTVNQPAQPVCLVEPYFGSNPQECALADARKDALAAAILAGCQRFLST